MIAPMFILGFECIVVKVLDVAGGQEVAEVFVLRRTDPVDKSLWNVGLALVVSFLPTFPKQNVYTAEDA
jgi:hypothetical protein